ncbi:MAG: ABC transporter permease, partial [Caldilineaceae bacterium]|nr:ABC transporter permease [Caldilineaceae bacterium]
MAVAQEAMALPKQPPRWQRLWQNVSIIFESRVGTIGLLIVLLWFFIAILSLVWTPYPPNAPDFLQNQPPSAEHLMGTDHLGRDVVSRLMTGAQVILVKTRLPGGLVLPGGVAVWGVLGSLVVGVVLGMLSGYFGGWTDQVIMQILDALIAFPRIILYLVVIASLGQGDLVVILAITVTGAPGVARLARSLAMDIKTRE